jgi:hypothetical protein
LSAPGSGTTGAAIAASALSATLSGATAASGTITFRVFGPQSSPPPDCSGGTVVGTASVSGDGSYHPAAGFAPTQAGTYWWYASYSGDTNNAGSNSGCGAGMMSTRVNTAPPPPTASLASASHSGSTESLTLACAGVSGQQCSINVVGTTRERKRGTAILAVTAKKHRGKPKVKTVTVTVAQGSFVVPAGQSATVRVTLNATGKRLRARFGKLPVKLSLTGSLTTTRTVVFKFALSRLRVSTPPDNWFHINLPCGNCYTTAQSVPIAGLARGVHVTVSCHGGGCPFSGRSVTPRGRQIDVAPVLAGSHLQPGAVVDVAISAKGRMGADVRYAIQRGAGPVRTILCLPPGASSPSRCT